MIHIIADSTSAIPQEMLSKYSNLHVIPLSLSIKESIFLRMKQQSGRLLNTLKRQIKQYLQASRAREIF